MADCHSVARKLEDASTGASSPLHRWPDVSHWQQVARARRKVAVDVEPTVTSSALAGRAVARARHVDEDGRVVRAGSEEHGARSWRCLTVGNSSGCPREAGRTLFKLRESFMDIHYVHSLDSGK